MKRMIILLHCYREYCPALLLQIIDKNRLATVLKEIRVEELALFRRVLPEGVVNTGSKPARSCAFYK